MGFSHVCICRVASYCLQTLSMYRSNMRCKQALNKVHSLVSSSLTWPDPIITQGHYHFQYKRLAQKESGLVHRPDWN